MIRTVKFAGRRSRSRQCCWVTIATRGGTWAA
jgi:hypothetical protein